MAAGKGRGERQGSGEMIQEARKVAAAARQEKTVMASDGLPMPQYPQSNPNSPKASPAAQPRPLPNTDARRYSSPSRDRPSREDSRPVLPAGQQALPGGPGPFGRREDSQGLGRGGGPGGQRPANQRLPSSEHARKDSTPWAMSGGGIDLTKPSPAPAQPQPGPQRRPQPSNAPASHRQSFSLSDDGPVGASGPTPNKPIGFNGRPGGGSPGPGTRPQQQQRPPAGRPVAAASPAPSQASSNKSNGPQTFAEMGFHSAPVQEKDCIIM